MKFVINFIMKFVIEFIQVKMVGFNLIKHIFRTEGNSEAIFFVIMFDLTKKFIYI